MPTAGSRALDLVLGIGLQDKDVFLALFTAAHVPLLCPFLWVELPSDFLSAVWAICCSSGTGW